MDQKEFMRKVVAILEKQQTALKKMAQVSTTEPAPQRLQPASPTKREAEAILNALQDPAKSAVARLEVHGSDVKVQFHQGKATQAAYDSVMATVQKLQQENVLPGQSYNVKVV